MGQTQPTAQTPALAALLYIAKQLSNPDFHKVCKLLYLADKLHLSEYGRFITNDNYKAYPYGPLPTEVYAVLKQERADMTQRFGFRVDTDDAKPRVIALQDPDMDQLSASDLETLDATIAAYGSKSFGYLTAKTHDSAWQAGRERTGSEMTLDEIVDTLPNKETLRAYLQGEHL